MKPLSVLTGALAGLVLAFGGAFAQQSSPPGRPDTKTIGDWQVRCFPVENPNPCDVFQERGDSRTQQRILTVSLAFAPSLNRHLLQITVPVGVALQRGLTIQADSYTSPVMKYRMCSREGCFVQVVPDNAVIEALTKAGSDAKINIVADGGKSFSLPLSLKGFSAAHDDMVTQARAKAKPEKAGDTAKP